MSLELSCSQDASSLSLENATDKKRKRGHWQWWLLVALYIFFLLAGQAVGTLLGQLYYSQGGNSKWMATLVQSAGFPVLIPIFFFPTPQPPSPTAATKPSKLALCFVYISVGLLIAGDNMMYSYGLLYLPVSTYSLICATQLAFNVLFSYFLNSQKITPFIINSVVLLTFSVALLASRASSSHQEGVTTAKYVAGFLCTLGASAVFSLILSLSQLSFERVLKKETFSVVLEFLFHTSMVATIVCVVGIFASGDWRILTQEMNAFKKGSVSYVMILVWTAVGWQLCSVGTLGLIFLVSSLFSNVISTMGLPLVPIFSVIFFHDKMDGVKVISMLLAIWGFVSYIYQNYLDESKLRRTRGTDASDAAGVPI